MSRRLEVRLGEVPVGQLSELPDGRSEFRFAPSYLDLSRRPVLGQHFEDDLSRTYRSRARHSLPDFFANLVPEGQLRAFVEKAGGLEKEDDFGVLAYVGRDLPGAVVLVPMEAEAPARPPTEPSSDADEPEANAHQAFRFSLAGVQLKFSMLREEERLALPASDGAGEWIVKFASPTYPYLPENELAMLEWARQAGFEVPECHLHPIDHLPESVKSYASVGTNVLAVRRYDRTAHMRIHQEDFAQCVGLPPSQKYEHLTYEAMAHLVRNFIGEEAVHELLRRLVFVIAAGNDDAHLKNWSLIYPDGVHARWAPVYDQVATIAWEGTSRELALKMAGVKRFTALDRRTIERFALRAGLGTEAVAEAAETLERLQASWREIQGDLPLVEEHRQALLDHWRRVPLLREAGGLV